MINNRKVDHLEICLKKDVEAGDAGFGGITLKHHALPEVDYERIDLSTKFLGHKLNFPLMIEGITGGAKQSREINRGLAKVAQKFGIGFGVGSQRAAIEDKRLEDTYKVRDVAPDIFLVANLGAVQLNCGYGIKDCRKAVEMIDADALALHVNPVQEVIQPEGDKNFSGLISKINEIARKLGKPVIVKAVGDGISAETARRLKVAAIDVGGVGGTHWSRVEGFRGDESTRSIGESFAGWGIPTVDCIREVSKLGVPTIASGGVRSGVDVAKSIALGADLAGMALPVLRAWNIGGSNEVEEYMQKVLTELRIAAFLTGSKNVRELGGKIR